MMKVGLVRRGHSASGGAESYLTRFAEALREAGHEPALFASDEWPADDWRFGKINRVSGATPRAFADALAALNPREKCDWLFSLERVWDCDCYRAGDGVHRAWLNRRARFEAPWRGWFRNFNRKHRELLELEAALFSPEKNRTIIANSKMVRDEIIRYFGFPNEKIAVIYNGLPLQKKTAANEQAARDETRRKLGFRNEDFVLLFAGSGWERKGLRFAIEGVNAANFSKPTLLVAGRGNARSMPHSDRVRFLGAVREMPAILAASDLFLLPTIYDPFSNACLEALAAGLPVITTDANGFSEIIEPGIEGEILRDPADFGSIANALERWRDAGKRAAIKAQLLSLAAEFSIEANLSATLALLQSR
jgi:UDP-glucose:(heptosyl)LPS alpha-1,3-glucosyltransferase